MTDLLATPADLASLLQRTDLDASTATLLLQMATGMVQGAVGQRLVEVVGDIATLTGTTDAWLDLPERPVTAVSSVVLDGVTLTVDTDYKVRGSRLWRSEGWQNQLGWPRDALWGDGRWYALPAVGQTGPATPSTAVVTYTHGYPAGDQRLQMARTVALSLAAGAYSAPTGGAVSMEAIDDYTVRFVDGAGRMELTPYMTAALRRAYGRRAGLVRLG